jgi:hypothetical protein
VSGGRARQVLAALLIGAGLLWLLGTLGLVSSRVLAALLTFWPLLLIGVGLDLLARSRRALGLPFSLLALGLIALLALIPGVGGASLRTFSEPVGLAHEAEIRLELTGAPTTVRALSGGGALIEASLRDRGEVRFSVSGSERKRITLERQRSPLGRLRVGDRWDIGLTPQLPLELTVLGGSSQAELNLADLDVRRLALRSGSGGARLTLPQGTQRSEVALESGSGRLEVALLSGADAVIRADTGSGGALFRVAPGGYLALELDAGSGGVEVDLPDGANVRLEVQGGGSGRLELPNSLQPAADEGGAQVWQTEGFAAGAGQVLITVVSRGSGSIRLY